MVEQKLERESESTETVSYIENGKVKTKDKDVKMRLGFKMTKVK